jgi:hypothetical protein
MRIIFSDLGLQLRLLTAFLITSIKNRVQCMYSPWLLVRRSSIEHIPPPQHTAVNAVHCCSYECLRVQLPAGACAAGTAHLVSPNMESVQPLQVLRIQLSHQQQPRHILQPSQPYCLQKDSNINSCPPQPMRPAAVAEACPLLSCTRNTSL